MELHLFIQTKKWWKPVSWLYHHTPEVDDVMCHGFKMFIFTFFWSGIQIIWNKWDDRD
jgi:hypothetical protein